MVKLIVIARCIPEDVYLRSLELPSSAPLAGEKKFSVVVREPEAWFIGRLAVEVRNRYESLYKREFGQIKYLKDNEDDCDLDPELSVSDLLVDEGKAAKDGADQRKIVKVIQEQGRALRQGSVIPDLTPSHYQPRVRPPVPQFPGLERRREEEEDQTIERPSKRRRLDQIEEETNGIVNSIEPNALNGNLNAVESGARIKQESPELAPQWINVEPATADELEWLPERPTHFNSRARAAPPRSRQRQDSGPEIRESSMIQSPVEARPVAHTTNGEPNQVVNRFMRTHSTLETQAPVTPPHTGHANRSPAGQAVSMLNSMKSKSPAAQPSTSNSANRFRMPVKNIYDYPESDIDDTQMSPRSRASRTRITPKLVQTPHANDKGASPAHASRNKSQSSTGVSHLPTQRHVNAGNELQGNGDKENHDPQSKRLGEALSKVGSAEQEPESEIDEADEMDIAPPETTTSLQAGQISVAGSDETWSVHEDGITKKKKNARRRRSRRNSTGETSSTTNPSMIEPKDQPLSSKRLSQPSRKQKRVAPTKLSDMQSRDDNSELDSPGVQLSEALRLSSPAAQSSKQTKQTSAQTSESNHSTRAEEDMDGGQRMRTDDIEAAPVSGSDSEEDMPRLKTPKSKSKKVKAPKPDPSDDRRCLTCWTKQSRCDNDPDRCAACVRNKKKCQEYSLTKAEANQIRAERSAKKAKGVKSTKTSNTPKSGPSDVIISASDNEDSIVTNGGSRSTQLSQSGTQNNRPDTHASHKTSKDEDKNNSQQKVASVAADESGSKIEKKQPKSKEPAVKQTTNSSERAANITPRVIKKADKTAFASDKLSQSEAQLKASRTEGSTKLSPSSTNKTDNNPKLFSTLATSQKDKRGSFGISKDSQPLLVGSAMPFTPTVDDHIASSGKILPPGMTQDEYDSLIGSRANLTEAQRNEKKLLFRKLGKQRDSTPSVSRASQDLADKSQQQTPSLKSSVREPSASQGPSKERSKPPPSTQPARIPASVTSETPPSAPRSAPAKSKAKASATQPEPHSGPPPIANTSTKLNRQNPPFRPHEALNPARKAVAKATGISTGSPSLGASRSLQDVRAALKSQSRSGSGASTPQSGLTSAARIAEMKRAVSKKKVFSLSDDEDEDDEDDEDSESDSKSDDGDKRVAGTSSNNAGTGGRGQVIVRRRTSTDTDSGSGSDSQADSDDED